MIIVDAAQLKGHIELSEVWCLPVVENKSGQGDEDVYCDEDEAWNIGEVALWKEENNTRQEITIVKHDSIEGKFTALLLSFFQIVDLLFHIACFTLLFL